MRVTVIAIASLFASAAFAQTAPSNPPSATSPAPSGVNEQQNMPAKSTLSSSDKSFVTQAAQANLAEIKLAELAIQKGSTADVRNLAQSMRDDHQKVGDRLQSIATRESFTLPSQPTADQRSTYDRLSALSGPEFDRAFLDQMKSDHQQAISLFQDESRNGVDPQLKSFAQSTLPSLQHHQQMVNRRSSKM